MHKWLHICCWWQNQLKFSLVAKKCISCLLMVMCAHTFMWPIVESLSTNIREIGHSKGFRDTRVFTLKLVEMQLQWNSTRVFFFNHVLSLVYTQFTRYSPETKWRPATACSLASRATRRYSARRVNNARRHLSWRASSKERHEARFRHCRLWEYVWLYFSILSCWSRVSAEMIDDPDDLFNSNARKGPHVVVEWPIGASLWSFLPELPC